jgi:hypothetical protein
MFKKPVCLETTIWPRQTSQSVSASGNTTREQCAYLFGCHIESFPDLDDGRALTVPVIVITDVIDNSPMFIRERTEIVSFGQFLCDVTTPGHHLLQESVVVQIVSRNLFSVHESSNENEKEDRSLFADCTPDNDISS